jgi:hypothetical protein
VDGDQRWISGLGVAELLDEVELRRRNGQQLALLVVAEGEASVTVFEAPERYSTVKSKPSNLPTQ